MSILSTTHLTKQCGQKPNIVKALDDVSISVEPGEFVAIIGTSGSGRSTLLNMLGGLDRPSSGGYGPDSRTISGELLAEIEGLGRDAVGRLYSRQVGLTPSEQARRNLSDHYTAERLEEFASYDPTFPTWKEGFDGVQSGQSVLCTVYGADGLILEAAVSENYISMYRIRLRRTHTNCWLRTEKRRIGHEHRFPKDYGGAV